MGIYGRAAVQATLYFLQSKAPSPGMAWQAAITLFSTSVESRRKCCPRDAYLGLCEAGVIKGIPEGKYGAPMNSKNARYAVEAYRILQSEPGLCGDKRALWARVKGPSSENNQMDVVLSLWNRGLLVMPEHSA
jgi:uncharacterized protein DUF6979